MYQYDILMGGATTEETIKRIPPQYRFVTVFNNSDYTVYLYGGNLSATVNNRFGNVPIYSHVTIPIPEGQQAVKVAWSGGSGDDRLTLAFTEQPLPSNVSFNPPSGVTSVSAADGAIVSLGATTSAESAAGDADLIAIVKNLRTRLAAVETSTASIAGEDFATQTTLAAVLAAVDGLEALLGGTGSLTANPPTGTSTATNTASATVKAGAGTVQSVMLTASVAGKIRLRDGGAGGTIRGVFGAPADGAQSEAFPTPLEFGTDIYVEVVSGTVEWVVQYK